ncbi:DUF6712 family protein [Spirosoma fluminis]
MRLFDGTTEQFAQYVPVNINFSLEAAIPELEAAELSILPRFLGDDLTEQIYELADKDDSYLNAHRHEQRALHLARVAVARIGFAGYLPFAEVQIGDDGITVSAADGRKAAFEYQTLKLERKLLEIGWRSMDELITLVASQPPTFPTWPDSPFYQEYQESIFKSPVEFSKCYPIQDRWLTFWALRPFIQRVEEDLGASAFERIEQLPGTITESQLGRVKRPLLRALAFQAVIEALPSLSIELNGANVQVNYGSQYGNAQYYQAPDKEHLGWVMDNLQKQCALFWSTFENNLATLTATPDSEPTPTGRGLLGGGAVAML